MLSIKYEYEYYDDTVPESPFVNPFDPSHQLPMLKAGDLAGLLAQRVFTTPLPLPSSSLVLCYDPAMERHCDDEPHPECPERTARIWEALEESGVTKREGVVKVEARLLVRAEAELVHEAEHWDNLHRLMEMTQEEINEETDYMNSIYLNPFSLDCALLAAGGVLQTVDEVGKTFTRRGSISQPTRRYKV